jgi:glutathione S-transferase
MPSNPTPIVHGVPASPFVSKVLALLEEKGLAYESRVLVTQPKTPALLAMNPLGKIPILEHGELVLPDSSAICAYLERLFPEPALYPKDARELALALWLEEYSDTRLLECAAPVVFERFVKPRFLGGTTDEARVREAIDELLPPTLDYLESRLADGAATFGSQLSIADLAVGCQLQTLALAGFEPDAARWPKLARYGAGLRRRPAFQRVRAHWEAR